MTPMEALIGWLAMPWEARREFLDMLVREGVLTEDESYAMPHRGPWGRETTA